MRAGERASRSNLIELVLQRTGRGDDGGAHHAAAADSLAEGARAATPNGVMHKPLLRAIVDALGAKPTGGVGDATDAAQVDKKGSLGRRGW